MQFAGILLINPVASASGSEDLNETEIEKPALSYLKNYSTKNQATSVTTIPTDYL